MGRSRLPLAIVVAVASAAVATFLLRPRSGLIDPVPVDAEAYFTALQLERAEDFRGLQRVLGFAGLAVSVGTLAVLAWRPPKRLLARLGERPRLGVLARRPLIGAAAAGAGISLLLVVTGLPVRAWQRARALDVGLATQAWPDWALDVLKAAGIGAATAAIGGAVAVALVRRFPRGWWAPGAALVVAYGVITIWLYPVVIDPLFNRFEPLRAGAVRAEVLELAERAGVDVGEVYRVDASRRTSAANAYVGGLGGSKRVVLYDNLIDDFPRDELRIVVAHELAHQKHRDLLRGLAWLALVAPAGTFLTQALAERFAKRTPGAERFAKRTPGAERFAKRTPGADSLPGDARSLPAIALAVTLVALALGSASNFLSRQVEARADSFAIDLTRDPGTFIDFERRITVRNISDPDPPWLPHVLFSTHPTTVERIGIGEAWRTE